MCYEADSSPMSSYEGNEPYCPRSRISFSNPFDPSVTPDEMSLEEVEVATGFDIDLVPERENEIGRVAGEMRFARAIARARWSPERWFAEAAPSSSERASSIRAQRVFAAELAVAVCFALESESRVERSSRPVRRALLAASIARFIFDLTPSIGALSPSRNACMADAKTGRPCRSKSVPLASHKNLLVNFLESNQLFESF